jgi:drug/metabolite transporter (DMT)-like permease
VTGYGLVTGRGREMAAALSGRWRRFAATAVLSMVTYALVLAAVRRAPVGYVAALRESSVLVAALMGWRYLDEGSIHRRMLGATIIVGGLVLLVVSG